MTNEDQAFRSQKIKEGIYSNCTFYHCTFEKMRGSQFSFCTFEQCHIQDDNLQKSRIQQCIFKECKLVALPFFQCEKRFFSPEFQNSLLMSCNFAEMMMKKGIFQKCKLKECFFTGTDLTSSDFSEADLEGTLFHRCNLTKANFTDAINYAIDPRTNTITKARFSLPEAASLLNAFEIELS